MQEHYQVVDRESGTPIDGKVINFLGACLTWKQNPSRFCVVQVQGLSGRVIAVIPDERCREFLSTQGL